jgi:hypothetical protein
MQLNLVAGSKSLITLAFLVAFICSVDSAQGMDNCATLFAMCQHHPHLASHGWDLEEIHSGNDGRTVTLTGTGLFTRFFNAV